MPGAVPGFSLISMKGVLARRYRLGNGQDAHRDGRIAVSCSRGSPLPRPEAVLTTKVDMMNVLLSALPTFVENWEAFRREWAEEVVDPPLYLALGDFARHVIAFLEAKDDDQLRRIFDAVERLHLEGDGYVREAATVGLLEDLQNTNLHRTTDPAQLRPFLRPETLKWWDRVDSFWQGNPRALQDDRDGGPATG
jgi:hypothetical protein